jgi:hypothetical protein
LVDLNGDGHIDLLSGSWPGELFLFRGGPERTFAVPEMIQNRDGQFINIGGGTRDAGDHILLTGHGEFEETEDGTFVNYHGQRLPSTPEKPIWITGTASAVHAVDWDGDGDYDLLVGDIRGNVYLIPNEGTAQAYAFGKEQPLQAAGKPVKVEGDAGPYVADWDGDGLADLLVGSGDGSVALYRNTGTAKAPKLSERVVLVAAGDAFENVTKEPRRGMRAKICVADWNGDGLADLLVGDYTTQKPDLPEPTAAEKVEHDKVRAQLSAVRQEYSKLSEKLFGDARPKTAAGQKALQEDLKKSRERLLELQSKLPSESETHGWVWLFLRRPA